MPWKKPPFLRRGDATTTWRRSAIMLRKLLTKRRDARRFAPSLPDGERVYAIGDVHGCDALLAQLLDAIDADDAARDKAATTIIVLGDLVDRGPESCAAIERLYQRTLGGARMRFLLGNHEEVFLKAIAGDPKALRLFCRIGGRETLMSYGVDPVSYERMDYADIAAVLKDVVPPHHVAFLQAFEDMIVVGDYAFVHAGIRPGVPLDAQAPQDLRWVREPFLGHRGTLDKTVVHGHSISDDVEFLDHRIGIDTGAYGSGRLTGLGLEADQRWTIEAR